jgi:signal transduction histidine kinase
VVYFAADAELRRERDVTISEELADLRLEGDTAALAREIGERETAHAHASFLYGLFDRGGHRLAGSPDMVPPPLGFSTTRFNDPVEARDPARARAVELADGSRLVVAVDSEAIDRIDATILSLFAAAFVGVLLIGVLGALALGRYLRQRLNAISSTAHAIIAGDSEHRVPVGPNGDEFDAVALALNAMLERIARLMENLRQVSSDVAHDLRTPLLRLRNQLDQVGRTEGAAQRAIELGDELLKLFAAMLRIAEVETGDLERSFARIDLSALVEDVGDGFLPALSDSGHRLELAVQADIAVLGDRELLAQAMANLLDNAQIHTPPGTPIVLALVAGDREATLSVADRGPGVPAEERQQVLRRFFRGDASRTTPGNGLGLSLVSAVAAAHAGKVTIDDADPGLRVSLALPRLA